MISSSSKEVYFRQAVNRLARFHGLHTLNELAGNLSLQQVRGEDGTVVSVPAANDIEKQLIALFVDTSEGSMTTVSMITELLDVLRGATQETRDNFLRTFQIWYTASHQNELAGTPSSETVDIRDIIGSAGGQSSLSINTTPNSPSKDSPGLSVILSNSHRVGLTQRDTNPAVLFLNSIPNVEMARAVPYVDATFYLGRPARNTSTKQVQSLSLPRFLIGAEVVEQGTPLADVVLANEISGTGNTVSATDTTRSVAGMEMFTSPQTLVNANEIDNPTLRGQAVLDKFRPPMSLTNLEVTVVPSTGLMAFKTATMGITVHDRSRLSEVADFIRPDLYGLTEISIEYGWIHPDGESHLSERNPYGDLLNGMRLKEKYTIVNSSFSMLDSGEIDIKLSLAMRGAEAFATELISSDEDGTGNAIRDVQALVETISELRSRVFGGEGSFQTREIRGVQILDAAQDALNHTNFGSDLQEALREFRNGLARTTSVEARTLLARLDELYGTASRRSRNNSSTNSSSGRSETYMSRLRRSVQDSVRAKMNALNDHPDPWVILPEGVSRGRVIQPNSDRATSRDLAAYRRDNGVQGVSEGSTSLAKLLLLFVGQPIALTGKFDDVQMVFYPFNGYAGKANSLNIGNFAVDNQFFADNFARWRLDRIGRSANVNLQDFVAFLGTTIIDDPAATSYGLWADGKSLFREIITEENGTRAPGVEALHDPADHITNLEQVLRTVTPDGSFRMPQIDFYLETTPEKRIAEDSVDSSVDTGKSILRIHVFDRQASSYDTLGALIANSRNTELSALGAIGQAPAVEAGSSLATSNPAVNESRARIHNSFLSAAEAAQIIETVPGTGTTSNTQTQVGRTSEERGPQMYRIRGGSRALKEFLYNTTPHITYGTIGTNIKTANLSSQQDAALSTVNLLRSFRRSELEPNGENPGGLPLRTIPTELNISSEGCPLLHFAQQFFCDFNTGTTADNFYGIVGLTHAMTQGSFVTSIRMAPLDAYGRYMGVIDQVRNAQAVLQELEDLKQENTSNNNTGFVPRSSR